MIITFAVLTIILWIELGLILSIFTGIEPWSTIHFMIKHRRREDLFIFLNAIFFWPFTLYLLKKDFQSQWQAN